MIRNLPAGKIDLHASYGDSYANTAGVAADATDQLVIHLIPKPQTKPPRAAPNKVATRKASSEIELGKPAPALSVAGWTDGNTRSLADFKGKVVVLDLWELTSGRCGWIMPVIQNLEARYKNRDVVFLSIHTADRSLEDVRDFLRHMKFDLTTAIDAGKNETSRRYGVKGYPTLLIIGRDGRIAWSNNRMPFEDGMKTMERAARALSIPWPLDEKQPEHKLNAQILSDSRLLLRRSDQ